MGWHFSLGFYFLAFLLRLLELLLSDSPYPGPGYPETLAFCFVSTVLGWRSIRLSLTVTPELVVVRSWFRTTRIPRHRVRGARVVTYTGWLQRGPVLRVLVLDCDDRAVTIYPIVGKPREVQSVWEGVLAALGKSRYEIDEILDGAKRLRWP